MRRSTTFLSRRGRWRERAAISSADISSGCVLGGVEEEDAVGFGGGEDGDF